MFNQKTKKNMERLTKNELANFFFKIGKNLKCYKYDVVHDLCKIDKDIRENKNEFLFYFYFVSNTGTWIISNEICSDTDLNFYLNQFTNAYFIGINSDKKSENFATLTKIQ